MGVKVAVVGAGRIGAAWEWMAPGRRKPCTHAGAYFSNPSVDELCIIDSDVEKAKAACKYFDGSRFGSVHTPMLTYGQSLSDIRDRNIDVVSVATPANTHYEIVKKLFDDSYGVKVIFCEKPFCSETLLQDTVNKAFDLVTSKPESVKVAVNHTRRWSWTWSEIKSVLTEGKLGKPVRACVMYTGSQIEVGIHMSDLLNWYGLYGARIPIDVIRPEGLDYLLFELSIFCEKGAIMTSKNGLNVKTYVVVRDTRYDTAEDIKTLSFDRGWGEFFDKATTPIQKACNEMVDLALHPQGERSKMPVTCSDLDGAVALQELWRL